MGMVAAVWGQAEVVDQQEEADVDLALCQLVRRTSNDIKQKLDIRTNCLSTVKSYGNLVRLCDEENIVSWAHLYNRVNMY